MNTIIPNNFEEFLYWVKETTEKRWANLSESKKDGNWWSQKHDLFEGAKWVDPLSDEEVNALEIKWGIKFPDDFKSFLKILHRVDKCDFFEEEDFETNEITLRENHLFHNWRDEELIKERFANPLEHLKFDVFSSIQPSWLKAWGTRPETEAECIAVMEKWMEKASILIPVNSHRYLISEPTQKCNHVISMYGFDTLLYSLNLREHLINELRWDLGLDEREYDDEDADEKPAPFAVAKAIKAIKKSNEDSDCTEDESEETEETETEEAILAREAELDKWYEERRKAYIPIPYWEDVILSTSSGWSTIGLKFPYEKYNSVVQPVLRVDDTAD
ncbi:SMI1/KNR4 family protein [Flavobacterium amniphilum]|uniref:SMI1/KNR4 family protein n=1 Tax=Flavobacterium amniphilum TaxID=1834035 RepID=UPI00202A217F|nr:SMI1/KNR4 family protein [Flavobacterium amniphilum]MCL9804462.1 SMI1/KNR4 family protein [Flavobacterium amniphilum]